MTNRRPATWKRLLPGFESPVVARDLQRRVANALRRLEWSDAEAAVRACSPATPCRSGLCPLCIRALRVRLLSFLECEGLDRLVWHHVTIRVEGWTVAPGDPRPFGPLRDHHVIEALLTKVRRLKRPGVLIFGSIETVYRTVANAPVGKPFHLHLMVSRLTKPEIEKAVRGTIPLSPTDVMPLNVRLVDPTREDFFSAASYALKLPFWRRSAARIGQKGDPQAPSASQLRELIGNLGVHAWTGRMILLGVRCDGGYFRLTTNLSATTPNANSIARRQKASPPRAQAPQGHRRGCRKKPAIGKTDNTACD